MGVGQEPTVRAVVVNLNGGAHIGDALQSLCEQDYRHLRTIVVDNGSTDGSIEAIRSRFPDVTLIENGKNLGFGGANNVGMRTAMDEGDAFVLLLNYDATLSADCVRALVERAVSSGAGMVGPKIMYHHDPDLIWSAGGSIHWWRGNVTHRGIRHKDRGQFDKALEVDYLTACVVLVDTRVLARAGMFDDAYFPSYFEDVDLCERSRRAGWRLLYEPRGVAWHRVSAHSGGGTTPLKVTLRMRNQLIFFRRYAQWYHWVMIPPCAACGAGAFLVRWCVQGRWRLIGSMFRGVGVALASRDAASEDRCRGSSGATRVTKGRLK